jgi:hypothetical protein
MYNVWVDTLGYEIAVIYGNIISYHYQIRPKDSGSREASVEGVRALAAHPRFRCFARVFPAKRLDLTRLRG